ncbi:hypothetical protein [Streptomyces netropsis]|uniref:Uncharacterized protein n=1 Tax=Streptomyces netropsis TaxID=55404 RepID=A0A7W7LGG8_STRNE|nr:hypothetical protein [Streptomyces netropsis]MBB4889752.1 hypothetical protein [Streptomyces netropsis]GGR40869.1 hypothetical protein GCM10010219_52550 [Streptomyces netropsis]
MSAPALSALNAPLLALRQFSAEFAHLPAPTLGVSTIFPDRLELSFHDDLAGFEAWRSALGILPSSVNYREQSGGRTRVLTAETGCADARVRLIGYADVPARDEARSRQGAVR